MNPPQPTPASTPQSTTPPTTPPPPAAPVAAAETGESCPNCGAATWGEFCFACGQPRKGLVRRFTSIMGDFLDTVFSIDNRLLRTVGPLYFKPGHLTMEYIAGRRVRYVTPFRLFFFLCVFSFLSLKFYANVTPGAIDFGDGDDPTIDGAQTPAEVDERLGTTLKGIAAGRTGIEAGMATAGAPAEARTVALAKLAEAESAARARAAARKAWLAEVDLAKAQGRPAPPEPPRQVDEDMSISFGDGPWDAEKNPIAIGWLPAAANAELNARAGRAKEALRHARDNPQPLIEAFFGAIPPATFVLMPLFAMLLKFMYLFKRRLYMEHLLTALHSHAFIFLSLLLISLSLIMRDSFAEGRAGLQSGLDWLVLAMAWWIPVHLLIAQKRIYAQGWIATLFKFAVVGTAYMVLLSLGLALAIVLGLFSL
jgi:hypothetical protein